MTEGRAGVPAPSEAECIEHPPIACLPVGYLSAEKNCLSALGRIGNGGWIAAEVETVVRRRGGDDGPLKTRQRLRDVGERVRIFLARKSLCE